MAEGSIRYAKVGGPPDNWRQLIVRAADGSEITEVIELNFGEGWLRRFATDVDGKRILDPLKKDFIVERIECEFMIEVRP